MVDSLQIVKSTCENRLSALCYVTVMHVGFSRSSSKTSWKRDTNGPRDCRFAWAIFQWEKHLNSQQSWKSEKVTLVIETDTCGVPLTWSPCNKSIWQRWWCSHILEAKQRRVRQRNRLQGPWIVLPDNPASSIERFRKRYTFGTFFSPLPVSLFGNPAKGRQVPRFNLTNLDGRHTSKPWAPVGTPS